MVNTEAQNILQQLRIFKFVSTGKKTYAYSFLKYAVKVKVKVKN